MNSVWVEAGANLAGSLIEQHAVDELIIYVAPKLLGITLEDYANSPHLKNLLMPHCGNCKNVKELGMI